MTGTLYMAGMILLMLALLSMAAWFAGSETAITTISGSQIARVVGQKRKGSGYLLKVKRNMDRSLVTILVANNIVNILLSSIAALFADTLFDAMGVSLMVGLITFLIITFGEIVPKSSSIDDSMKVSLRRARWIHYLTIMFTPIDVFLVWISNGVKRIRGRRPKKKVLISDQAVKDMVRLGEEEGVFKPIERDIIDKVFVFGDRYVRDIMLPMRDVFHVDRDMSVEEARELFHSRGYTRVPFIDKRGRLKGLVYSKDLLSGDDERLSSKIRKPILIGEDTEITKAFDMMKEKRVHLAVVVDKKGKPQGIVTLEDVLEEIVGEIYDEYFPVKYRDIKKEGKGSIRKYRGNPA
jgi:putative hemolysin